MRAGFGVEVEAAMKRRKATLVEKGYAWHTPDGTIRAPKNLVARLEQGEIERAGNSLTAEKQMAFTMKGDGERVSGVFTGTMNLVSGKCAIIENAYEFTLIPWRPVMDERLGRQMSGVLRNGSVSWDFTRARGLGVGM